LNSLLAEQSTTPGTLETVMGGCATHNRHNIGLCAIPYFVWPAPP